jgi:hypothetical protein
MLVIPVYLIKAYGGMAVFILLPMVLQPGVGLGLLYNVPPDLSIPCSVFPFI